MIPALSLMVHECDTEIDDHDSVFRFRRNVFANKTLM